MRYRWFEVAMGYEFDAVILEAKRPETMRNRIEKTLVMILSRKMK